MDGLILDVPHVIVTPVNLKNQWEQEIKCYLKLASFDLFPYIGQFDGWLNWWDVLCAKSHQNSHID